MIAKRLFSSKGRLSVDEKRRDELITIISNHSDRYGNLLIKFLVRYNLTNLQQAGIEQLEEFIREEIKER